MKKKKTKVKEEINPVLRAYRFREDLKLQVLKLISDFKSKEEPNHEITNNDIVHVMSAIITRKTR